MTDRAQIMTAGALVDRVADGNPVTLIGVVVAAFAVMEPEDRERVLVVLNDRYGSCGVDRYAHSQHGPQ